MARDRAADANPAVRLTKLLVLEALPAWTSNRLKRLVLSPKRYVVDAALAAAVLRLDVIAILRSGDLLGRLLDTFRGVAVAGRAYRQRLATTSVSPPPGADGHLTDPKTAATDPVAPVQDGVGQA